MEIRITFIGGPHDQRVAFTDSLNELKVLFLPDKREIAAYKRFNEVEYHWNENVSDRLTEGYDKAHAWYADPKNTDYSTLRFIAGPFGTRPIQEHEDTE